MSPLFEAIAIQAKHSRPTGDTQKLSTSFYIERTKSTDSILVKNNFSETVPIRNHYD